jgi:hypothetical protein
MKKLLMFTGVFLFTGSAFCQDVPKKKATAPAPKSTPVQSPQKLKSGKVVKTYRQPGNSVESPPHTPATVSPKKSQ